MLPVVKLTVFKYLNIRTLEREMERRERDFKVFNNVQKIDI